MSGETIFVSGGSGLIGRGVIRRLLADPRVERVYALARRPMQGGERLVYLEGDLERPALALGRDDRWTLASEVTTVIHLAATTSFSQMADEARAVNVYGTRRLLELGASWSAVRRW